MDLLRLSVEAACNSVPGSTVVMHVWSKSYIYLSQLLNINNDLKWKFTFLTYLLILNIWSPKNTGTDVKIIMITGNIEQWKTLFWEHNWREFRTQIHKDKYQNKKRKSLDQSWKAKLKLLPCWSYIWLYQ